jgi:hypothetical protein
LGTERHDKNPKCSLQLPKTGLKYNVIEETKSMSKRSSYEQKSQRAAAGENAVWMFTVNGLTSATRRYSRSCRDFNPLSIEHALSVYE